MGKINFDHSYTEDIGHKFFKKLGGMGFSLAENQVEHPGKNFCRFITFSADPKSRNYLEFVHVGHGGERVNKPGVSLRYEGALKEYFAARKGRKGAKINYYHRNYDWKKDKDSDLPGWNFMTFLRPKFKNIYLWFTEYEPRPGLKRKRPVPHRNTAQGIIGMQLAVRGADRVRLGAVFGQELNVGVIDLGGAQIFVEPGRTTRISALVVACKSLKRFMRVAGIKTTVPWRGKVAALIKNPDSRMWDIIVVEQ